MFIHGGAGAISSPVKNYSTSVILARNGWGQVSHVGFVRLHVERFPTSLLDDLPKVQIVLLQRLDTSDIFAGVTGRFQLIRDVGRSRERRAWANNLLLAIPKKYFRSALVKRPLPSAMLDEIDNAARFNWSAKKL